MDNKTTKREGEVAYDRLMAFMAKQGMSIRAFAKQAGIPPTSLISMGQRYAGLSEKALADIKIGFPTLNLNWVIAGVGDMQEKRSTTISGTNVQQVEQNHGLALQVPAINPAQNGYTELAEQIALLKSALADKEKIIALLEKQLKTK